MLNTRWQQFLVAQGARIDGELVRHYGDRRLELTTAMRYPWMANLSHFACIQVSGVNTTEFLQGQLICDVKRMTSDGAYLGAYCNPQGRLLASFYIWRQADYFYLCVPRSMLTFAVAHLSKYAIFSKVKLSPTGDNIVIVATTADPDLVPMTGLTHLPFSPATAMTQSTRYLLLGQVDNVIAWWEKASSMVTPIGATAWHTLNLRDGLSFIYPQTRGLFLPQMINLAKWEGVSFDKGCYVGQEIIARTEHLGTLKRRLYYGQINCDVPILPATTLTNNTAQTIGTIVESSPGETTLELLAVLQTQMLQQESHVYYQDQLLTLHPCQ